MLLKKFFKHKPTVAQPTDRVVCRITVYNRAIAALIAEYDIKASERYLIGGIKESYPTSTYRINVVNY